MPSVTKYMHQQHIKLRNSNFVVVNIYYNYNYIYNVNLLQRNQHIRVDKAWVGSQIKNKFIKI